MPSSAITGLSPFTYNVTAFYENFGFSGRLTWSVRDAFVEFLTGELGTDSIDRAKTYLEDALRMTVHLIMSTPEYQIA